MANYLNDLYRGWMEGDVVIDDLTGDIIHPRDAVLDERGYTVHRRHLYHDPEEHFIDLLFDAVDTIVATEGLENAWTDNNGRPWENTYRDE